MLPARNALAVWSLRHGPEILTICRPEQMGAAIIYAMCDLRGG